MQLVEANKIELDAPVQRYLPGSASQMKRRPRRSPYVTCSTIRAGSPPRPAGLTRVTATRATQPGAGGSQVEDVELTAPVGSKHQYSTINYWSWDSSCRRSPGGPTNLRPGEDLRSAPDAALVHIRDRRAAGPPADRPQLLVRPPRAADLPYNRGLVPAGYLISSAEDMTHYLISQLHGGRYEGRSVCRREGSASTPTGRSDAGGGHVVWHGLVRRPLNDIPVVHHQGETFNFHANVVLIPQSRKAVVVLMNAENSLDLFTGGRMGTIVDGVSSLLVRAEAPVSPVEHRDLHRLRGTVCAARAAGPRHCQVGRCTEPRGCPTRPDRPVVARRPLASVELDLGAVRPGALAEQLGRRSGRRYWFPDLVYMLLVSALVALGWAVQGGLDLRRPTRRARSTGGSDLSDGPRGTPRTPRGSGRRLRRCGRPRPSGRATSPTPRRRGSP